jgi:sugar phosphate isomerase/epimerase
MVHGSPGQRKVSPGDTLEAAWGRARDCFRQIAEHAGAAGVSYCIEPLARTETQLVNTLEDAARMVSEVGHAAVRSMLDTSSAGRTENLGTAELIDQWMPTGLIRHVQVNDRNRRGPGQGDDLFAPVFAALERNGYGGVVSVEPFDYLPDGQATAARAIGYIRGILEALATKAK